MIEIRTNSTELENTTGVDIKVRMSGDSKTLTKELYTILKSLDDRVPQLLMDAVDMHIKHIIKVCNEVDDDD